jgi:hypothetical protein
MAPNRMNAQWLRLALSALALGALAVLGGCGGGSGAPNNPFKPPPTTPGPVTIIPASATVYANTPATLTVVGGVPPYFVASSNTAILPIGASVTNGTIVLLPANVLADTAVVISAQDSAGTSTSVTVTVKPAPIFNTLSVKPNSAACGSNAVCSGQTATASVTVTGPGGVGIPNRQVKFDVVAGAFAIVSTDPANPLVSTLTTVSDQFGVAQVILQATPGAFTQPALLRATELTTGNQQTAQFTIVQTINGAAVLSVVPATVTITGPDTSTCSSGFRIDYYIYGGQPPYSIVSTFPNSVTIVNSTVAASGQPFTVLTNGACVNPLVFSIRDANGLQTTATLINTPGTTAPPPPPPPVPPSLSVSPKSQNIVSCDAKSTSVFVSGGIPPYNVTAATTTVNGVPVTPTIGSPSLPGAGFDSITLPNQPNGMPTPVNTVYNFAASDSGGAQQQTVAFTITCK